MLEFVSVAMIQLIRVFLFPENKQTNKQTAPTLAVLFLKL